MGAHWNTQKYIKIHHNTSCIVMYFDVFLRIPMGSHHNTATIRVVATQQNLYTEQRRWFFDYIVYCGGG